MITHKGQSELIKIKWGVAVLSCLAITLTVTESVIKQVSLYEMGQPNDLLAPPVRLEQRNSSKTLRESMVANFVFFASLEEELTPHYPRIQAIRGSVFQQRPRGGMPMVTSGPKGFLVDDKSPVIVIVQEGHAVLIPLESERPIILVSSDHMFCNGCIAKGFDINGVPWLIQWHFEPSGVTRALSKIEQLRIRAGEKFIPTDEDKLGSTQVLRDHLPEWLRELRDIQIVLSPRKDISQYPDPEKLRQQWDVKTLTLMPRADNTQVSTLVTKDGVAFFLHSWLLRAVKTTTLNYRNLLESDKFYTWSWEDLKTNVQPLEFIVPSIMQKTVEISL